MTRRQKWRLWVGFAVGSAIVLMFWLTWPNEPHTWQLSVLALFSGIGVGQLVWVWTMEPWRRGR